ncbi:unnamed protein product [Camellia sinensis]
MNDLHQLFQQFGVVTKVVMLRAKNQALLQMQDIPSAVNALQFYTNVQPSIRGRNVYVQFSSHQELTTMDQNSQGRGDEEKTLYWKRNDEAEAATNVGTFELINFKEDPFIKDYREHNDDTTVHFEVIMSEENLIMAKQEGLLKKFKLTTTISTSNMHLFDPKGVIKKYETLEQILEEFFHESECVRWDGHDHPMHKVLFNLDICTGHLFSAVWVILTIMTNVFQRDLSKFISRPSARKVKHVFANDLNPFAVEYLERNCVLNKLERKIEVFNMDGRRFIDAMFASQKAQSITQVVMNLPNDAAEYLDG